MKLRLACIAAAILGLVLAVQVSVARAEPEPEPEPEPTLSSFTGHWRWVGGESELRALDSAIEKCVSKMNIFIRGIARRRIRKPNQPSPELMVTLEGQNLAVRRPGRPALSAPADGRPIDWREPGGDQFRVSHGLDHGVMYQRFEGASSFSLNRYLLDPKGRRMVVHTHITSKRLPMPIEFDTTYERSP